jgi:hypothetical protein
MNGLQIYLLGCLLAYPIGVYILKILNQPDEVGLFQQCQKILQQLNFHKSIKFYYNLTLSILVLMSWITILIQIYFTIKAVFYALVDNLYNK